MSLAPFDVLQLSHLCTVTSRTSRNLEQSALTSSRLARTLLHGSQSIQLSDMTMQDTLKITRALSDGSRLRIVVSLAGVAELCACQITEMLGLSPATVSRHLSVLLNANLVRSRKDSRWVYYRLSDDFPPLPKRWLMESAYLSREAADDRKLLQYMLESGVETLCHPRTIGESDTVDSEARPLAKVEPGALTMTGTPHPRFPQERRRLSV